MFTKTITYKDFNGNEKTRKFYFHMGEPELIELEAEANGGMINYLQRIIDTEDKSAMVREFKRLILMAYGVKSDDGESFEKSAALNQAFAQTAAFNALYMELATDDNAAADFLIGIMPSDMQENLSESLAAFREDGTLPPPSAPGTV